MSPSSSPAGFARRLWREVGDDDLPLLAAGLAFYAVLGLFPGLTALVALYGLIADPGDVQGLIASYGSLLPAEVRGLLARELIALADARANTQLGIGLGVSLVLLLWSASSGAQALIRGINLAFDQTEARPFYRHRLLALALTLGALAFFAVAVAAIAVVPALLATLALGPKVEAWISWLRWPLLTAAVFGALVPIYRYAPYRRRRPQRFAIGALLAAGLWLLGSSLFSLYVAGFGRYHATYGALGGVVVLLLWLYLSAFVVLLGAEVEAVLDQLAEDQRT